MNLYQPTITGSLSVSGSINISGSINVVGGGGTITGTASYATNADLLDGLDSTVFTLTSSFAAQTASFTAFTSSVNSFTASINSFSASVLSYTSSLNAKTSSFATTGSNTFAGIQTINSNLIVTGSITAQTLVVQTITSSVDFVTGSTRFGSLLTNTHVFSGSVSMNPGGLFVSSSGYVGIGTTSLRDTFVVSGNGGAVLERFTGTDPYSGDLYFYSAKGTAASPTTKANGDTAMGIRPRAYDGTSYLDVASIVSKIDGVVSTNVMPGNLIFSTNGGGTTLAERMRIASNGKISISAPTTADAFTVQGANNYWTSILTSGTTTSQAYGLYVKAGTNASDVSFLIQNTSGTDILRILGTGTATFTGQINSSMGNDQLFFNATSATTGYQYMNISNTSGGLLIGVEGTTAGNLQSGDIAYSSVITTRNASNLSLGTNQVERLRIASGGAITIAGSLSKGSGTFRIDHPLESKKDTHQLVHSFVEGPRADLIYRGTTTLVNGTATINIDETVGMTEGTFIALNRDIQCFTTNESGWDLVKGKVEGNILTIISQNTESTNEISWMVVGERQDEHIKNTDWTDENGKPILEPSK